MTSQLKLHRRKYNLNTNRSRITTIMATIVAITVGDTTDVTEATTAEGTTAVAMAVKKKAVKAAAHTSEKKCETPNPSALGLSKKTPKAVTLQKRQEKMPNVVHTCRSKSHRKVKAAPGKAAEAVGDTAGVVDTVADVEADGSARELGSDKNLRKNSRNPFSKPFHRSQSKLLRF